MPAKSIASQTKSKGLQANSPRLRSCTASLSMAWI
jgi:hypothetical protein